MAEKLTDSSDEAYVQDLFDARAIFEIPYFQRPYKWEPKRLRRFETDLVRLADEGDLNDTHFLGAVIIQGSQPRTPVESTVYQVIDGQQRLTTMFLYLLATIRELIEVNKEDEINYAKVLFESYIVVAKPPVGKSNIKIQSCGEDREAMNSVIQEVLNLNNFKSLLDRPVIPLLTNTQNSNDRVLKNFKEAKKFLFEQRKEFGIERVKNLNIAMMLGMSMVQINVKNSLSGPKIFDALNSQQQPMTVGELVKNDIFSRGMGSETTDIDVLYEDTWEPFYSAFGPPKDSLFDNYFFPYGLISIDSNVRKGDVYAELRKSWESKGTSPKEIIESLSLLQPDYLDFHLDGNRCGHPTEVAQLVANLRNLGVPTSIFSFLIKISYELRTEGISKETAISLLRGTESFLVRRGVHGLEPSGLHAAFKGLWDEIISDIADEVPDETNLLNSFIEKIDARSTVQWPSDIEFKNSFTTRNLYGSRITPYILSEYNKSLGNDGVVGDFEIEHVLPQNPDNSWSASFTKSTAKLLVDNIGNLTLLTEKMNQDVSNGPYAKKKEKFGLESRFRISRKLADENAVWTPDSIKKRTNEMAEWAMLRWPECKQPNTDEDNSAD
jgi:hypothetical protein